ncbi:general secretion pathway protein L [Variovorax boronicumulans]|uniref:General secretion pathway protein L n=1 Tax=Variovorax boronicumulans TaxID=436515 RepID=A0AAW8E3Z7_9BURK|nr:type II secretion system protein GspL [Variovorax boronicumulans]MDP9881278.1 general secretion pathway protein L [Variovorax boronicumulans]MDP9926565.1 general secretion pathway protein L [Variovorax boronicumulans]
MSALKVDRLRLQLPPWPDEGEADPVDAEVHCGWRAADGRWHDGGALALGAVAGCFEARHLEVALAPGEVALASFALPPLTARHLHAAVLGAIEPCALQPIDALAVGIGPRGADGTVPTAWIARDTMARWLTLLRRHGIAPRALCVPTAFLPTPTQGWTGLQLDRWLVVRTGAGAGFMQALPHGADRDAALAAYVTSGEAASPVVHWTEQEEGDAARWSGEGWRWALSASDPAQAHAGVAALLRPAALWGCMAALVWTAGLQVHAHRLATQGQALKREMAARVKAAFPELPVVVNPVQQARQQKEARAGQAPQAAVGGDYAALSRAAVGLLAQLPAGQVQALHYTAGELRIRWREGAAPNTEALRVLQAQAHERSLSADPEAGALRVTPATARAEKDTP